ncbi:MAG TPA: hypothetical protein VE868_12760 [Balneolaceae bacterium]|nr:hypothetical protein [Balneolaceae bacterium]
MPISGDPSGADFFLTLHSAGFLTLFFQRPGAGQPSYYRESRFKLFGYPELRPDHGNRAKTVKKSREFYFLEEGGILRF